MTGGGGGDTWQAIEVDPKSAQAWRRRAQARADFSREVPGMGACSLALARVGLVGPTRQGLVLGSGVGGFHRGFAMGA